MTPDLDQVLSRLRTAGKPDAKGRVRAYCFNHDDRHTPNLLVYPSGAAKCFVCDAYWSPPELARALGIERGPRGREEAVYDYKGEDGALLFQVVRLRDPSTGAKTFRQRRPDGSQPDGWAWNLRGVERVPYRLPDLLRSDPEAWVFVVEGEKDADRLWSLGLVATTNPGGAGKWSHRYRRWLAGRRVAVIPDNDPPDPRRHGLRVGLDHAHQVALSLHGVAATVRLLELEGLPDHGDVSDWLDAGHRPDELLALAEAAPDYVPGQYVRPGANGKGREAEESLEDTEVVWSGSKHRAASQHLIHRGLLRRGSFITAEGRYYYFAHQTRQLCEIGSFDMEVLLNDRYGLNAQEALYSYMERDMRVEAALRGTRATVHQFAYYDPAANVMYLDLGGGRVLRMDGDRIQEVDNGTDGVLFTPVPGAEPWTFDPEAPDFELEEVLVRGMPFVQSDEGSHDAEEQRALVLLWLHSLAFASVMPTKPLALAVGPAGAGKSSFFRRVGRLLYGPEFDVDALSREGEEQFFVAVTNRPFVAFDNVDKRVGWLDDALAGVATGMKITKRVLFSTNQAATYTARAFIALTARTPKFRREDVAERLLIFHLDKLPHKRPEYEVLSEITDRRDALLSDYAKRVNDVVAVREWPEVDQTIRLADFARVAARAGQGLGIPRLASQVLGKLRRAQHLYATEESDLYLLLDMWVGDRSPAPGAMDIAQSNAGRKVSASTLYRELHDLAVANALAWHFASPKGLGRQLQALEEALGVHFRIERGRDMKGRWWRFWPAEAEEGS